MFYKINLILSVLYIKCSFVFSLCHFRYVCHPVKNFDLSYRLIVFVEETEVFCYCRVVDKTKRRIYLIRIDLPHALLPFFPKYLYLWYVYCYYGCFEHICLGVVHLSNFLWTILSSFHDMHQPERKLTKNF